jgi:hypothetical protein
VRSEHRAEGPLIPPTTYDFWTLGCGGSPVQAARKEIDQALCWQMLASLRGDLCEHRSATAALHRARVKLKLATYDQD